MLSLLKKCPLSAYLFLALFNSYTLAQSTELTTKAAAVEQTDGSKAFLLYQGTYSDAELAIWKKLELAPKGSSALTGSGDLAKSGIKFILHAATGSMGGQDESTEPTLQSIRESIVASLRIANSLGIKRVAVPFLGGGIFLSRLAVTKEVLAKEIIEAASESKTQTEVVFVGYTDEETATLKEAFNKFKKDRAPHLRPRLWFHKHAPLIGPKLTEAETFISRSEVVKGSLTDYEVHKAPAIVNAANMELIFGGGLSGVIGRATGQQDEINETGSRLIQKFYAQ